MNFSSNASMSLIELDTIRVAGTTFLIVEDSSTRQNNYSSARILTGYVVILLAAVKKIGCRFCPSKLKFLITKKKI